MCLESLKLLPFLNSFGFKRVAGLVSMSQVKSTNNVRMITGICYLKVFLVKVKAALNEKIS